jgi:PPM family protein phosphatase
MLEVFGATHLGSVRKNNEDSYLIIPELGLYLIADGMGGARAGEHASRIAVETVAELAKASGRKSPRILLDAFEEAHERVRAAATADPNLEGMGTTLVAALEAGDELLVASVGDSRAYLFQDHKLEMITTDQTWVAEVGRPLGISEEDLRTHPLRHVLTMALGANAPLKAQSYAVPITPGALFLLCTDGLHGAVEQEVIREALDSEQTLESRAHYLIDAAIQAGGPDNVTLVLLRAPKQ